MSIAIVGVVRGTVHFHDHPQHEGHWGLVGGEDVLAQRSTFRSVGEAMTWCRKVLDGTIRNPRWEAAGDLLEPREDPSWHEGRVAVTDSYEGDVQAWVTGDKRGWYEVLDLNRDVLATEPARVDPEP